MTSYPCSICDKSVKNDAIFCNFCELWVHPTCNRLAKSDFLKLVESKETEIWSCYKCNCTLFPFNSETDESFNLSQTCRSDNCRSNFSQQHFTESLESLNCKYYDTTSFNTMISDSKIPNLSSMSFFHLNINSLSLHFDSLERKEKVHLNRVY